jgi:hypothetical protein
MTKKSCQLCYNNISNTNNNIDNCPLKKKINEKYIHLICDKCLNNNSYINLSDKLDIDFSCFYLKIFLCNGSFYILSNEWKDYVKTTLYKKREDIRKKEIESVLKEYKLENIKPSLCSSYIKYGIPSIENIVSIFQKEQNKKEKRLFNLIKELKKNGKEYDENIPMYETYIKEGGDILKIVRESELEKSLIYNTNYKHYLKHNNVQTARYLATMEFINSGKHNDIIHKFASEKNTLDFI